MKCNYILIILLIFIVSLETAAADISVTLPGKSIYNLGDKITPTISIKEDKSHNGIFSLFIECDNYELQYYTTPLDIVANSRTQLNIPELTLSKSMMTKCLLKTNFEQDNGILISDGKSKNFFVTDSLNLTLNNLEVKPGQDLIISGDVKKYNNEYLSNGNVEISFLGSDHKAEVNAGIFEYSIPIKIDLDAGSYPLNIKVSDKYDNFKETNVNVKILPIPTRIENIFSKNSLIPAEVTEVKITLFDHTDKPVSSESINVKILGPEKNIIIEKNILSSTFFDFNIGNDNPPGTYFLQSSFQRIKEQSSFQIKSYKKLSMDIDGNFINIENIGNILYKDEITLILENEAGKFIVKEKLNLNPQEKITLDMSKEIPNGNYDLILPEDAVNKADPAEEQNIIKDIVIDNSNQKINDNQRMLSSITGAAISTAGFIASKPLLAASVLIVIVLGTVTRYSWSFLKEKVKGKKDDTEDLFKDFKYE